MGPVDIVILALVLAGVAAVVVRVSRKGVCADCAEGATCSGHCGRKKTCPAAKGSDKVYEELAKRFDA